MLPAIPLLISGLATAFSFLIKHPLVTKMLTFSFFVAVVTYSISSLKVYVSGFIHTNSLFSIASYFGILDGLSLFLTIIIAGFGAKQVIAFIRT